ncbi:protein of unknown function [Brochothrix thermosphacta]|nr:protein of unknown function [Brochothrix thermosphacta]
MTLICLCNKIHLYRGYASQKYLGNFYTLIYIGVFFVYKYKLVYLEQHTNTPFIFHT